MQHAFLYILGRRCTNATGNFLISRARFMKLVNTAQNFLFFFFYQLRSFWIQPQTRISRTFDKLSEIQWDRWSLKQPQFTFLSDVFGLLSFRSFATMATRVKASLYWGCLKLVSSLTVFQSSLLSSATFDIIFSLTRSCNLPFTSNFS